MKKRTKAGGSKASVAQRDALFVDAYLKHNENGTAAAIEVGISERSAHVIACRWLKKPNVQKLLERRRAELRGKFRLDSDRMAQEIARVAYFNPRRMLDEKGEPLPLAKIDEDTAAGLQLELDGESNVLKVKTVRISEKNTAIEKGIKILRLYDKPPPPPPDEEQTTFDPRETAKRMAFLLRAGAAAGEKKPATQRPKPKKKVLAAV